MDNQIIKGDIFEPHFDYEQLLFEQIKKEWGYSSKKLKDWLNTYYPNVLNNKEYSRKAGLNADVFLPYLRNRFWTGANAISRLKLAVKAEVVIIFSNTELTKPQQIDIYVTECLRLWTRINSLTTSMTIDQFKALLNDCYNEVINDWDKQIEYLQNKQESIKPKKDQVLYHFTREDFEPIRYEKNLKIAYKIWIDKVFPTLLDKYKDYKLNEYRKELGHVTYEEWEVKRDLYKAKLDKIKITKIKYRRFAILIKKIKNGEL